MVGLAPRMPAGVQRRDQPLAVQTAQHLRHARRQVVVEQHRAGVEALHPQPAAMAHQRFKRQGGAVGQLQSGRRGDLGEQAAEAHLQPGEAQDRHQLGHVLQVELVAGVVFGNQQHPPRVGADALDRRLRGLHAQRQEGLVEIVEAAGKQVEVHRRQLEAGIAQIGGAIERRMSLQPAAAKPLLDGGALVEKMALQLKQGAGQGRGQVRNHAVDSPGTGARRRGWFFRRILHPRRALPSAGMPRVQPCGMPRELATKPLRSMR